MRLDSPALPFPRVVAFFGFAAAFALEGTAASAPMPEEIKPPKPRPSRFASLAITLILLGNKNVSSGLQSGIHRDAIGRLDP